MFALLTSQDKREQFALVWLSLPIGVLLSGPISFLFLTQSSTVNDYPWVTKGGYIPGHVTNIEKDLCAGVFLRGLRFPLNQLSFTLRVT